MAEAKDRDLICIFLRNINNMEYENPKKIPNFLREFKLVNMQIKEDGITIFLCEQ
jgi:hypothetical protein